MLAGRTIGRRVHGAASTCGCRSTTATRSIGAPRHVRAAADAAGRRAGRDCTCGSGFTFADGGPELRFVDQRTFGGLAVSRGGAELPAEIAHIARDPIDPLLRPTRTSWPRCARKHTEVKRALLDQTLISGVGNIYADEALWRAKLHGARPTDR